MNKLSKCGSTIIIGFTLVGIVVFLIYGGIVKKGNLASSSTNEDDIRYDFISKVGVIAKEQFKEYGVYPSITIAQAIIESGWGKSGLTKQSNNLFGLKVDKNWDGDYLEFSVKNGTIQFRKYKSIDDSIADYAKFIVETIGEEDVKESKNYKEQIEKLQILRYSSDSNYSTKIIELIEKYNLDDFDKI
ncbi:MAG: glucosaminidase domain-containing protein [Bacilli bacterium]